MKYTLFRVFNDFYEILCFDKILLFGSTYIVTYLVNTIKKAYLENEGSLVAQKFIKIYAYYEYESNSVHLSGRWNI